MEHSQKVKDKLLQQIVQLFSKKRGKLFKASKYTLSNTKKLSF